MIRCMRSRFADRDRFAEFFAQRTLPPGPSNQETLLQGKLGQVAFPKSGPEPHMHPVEHEVKLGGAGFGRNE
jgi:hypothetical protein